MNETPNTPQYTPPPVPPAPAAENPQTPAPAPASPQPDAGTHQPVDARTDEPAPRPSVPPPAPEPPAADPDAQSVVEHVIAPGSVGLAVRELAQLVETINPGTTYLSRGENADNVFHDDLMNAVRQVLIDHHKETADIGELEQKLREVAITNEVTADTWLLLRAKAEAAANE